MFNDVLAGGIVAIIGAIFGIILTILYDKIQNKKEFPILKRKIERILDNMYSNTFLLESYVSERSTISHINGLSEMNKTLQATNFFNSAYELEKISGQIIYYKDSTEKFEKNIQDFTIRVRFLNIMLADLEQRSNYPKNKSDTLYDVKPQLQECLKSMRDFLIEAQFEIEKIK